MVLRWSPIFLYALGVFLSFESSIASMETEDKENLYSYLERELTSQTIERFDPPFYKLTAGNGKIIYVLGSIHDRHPKLLLPQAVFKVIEELSGQTVPFMEHVSPYEYLIQKLPGTNDQSKEFWNPEMDFKLSENDIKIWQAIKDEHIYIDGPKVENIVKMDEVLGVMLFYIVARKKSEEIGIVMGFETTIYDKQWQE